MDVFGGRKESHLCSTSEDDFGPNSTHTFNKTSRNSSSGNIRSKLSCMRCISFTQTSHKNTHDDTHVKLLQTHDQAQINIHATPTRSLLLESGCSLEPLVDCPSSGLNQPWKRPSASPRPARRTKNQNFQRKPLHFVLDNAQHCIFRLHSKCMLPARPGCAPFADPIDISTA